MRGQCALELGGAIIGLAVDEGVQTGLCLLEMRVGLFRLIERAAKHDCRRRGQHRR